MRGTSVRGTRRAPVGRGTNHAMVLYCGCYGGSGTNHAMVLCCGCYGGSDNPLPCRKELKLYSEIDKQASHPGYIPTSYAIFILAVSSYLKTTAEHEKL